MQRSGGVENLELKMAQSEWRTQVGQGWGSGEEGRQVRGLKLLVD